MTKKLFSNHPPCYWVAFLSLPFLDRLPHSGKRSAHGHIHLNGLLRLGISSQLAVELQALQFVSVPLRILHHVKNLLHHLLPRQNGREVLPQHRRLLRCLSQA